ncbi:hypothetical protein JAAARDRAFT_197343 [Jaapia argillacea MUCL 33604]|uniref:Uncharacterized protein n=1 Tax=Jaapia argillacea MUCL 33604 TaxID=933084 RepID=A0A067PI78_9AGAM|nr:hypothetical protein JAAARDRAFT_197343 [Jaapia argillacea MUCL 33604]
MQPAALVFAAMAFSASFANSVAVASDNSAVKIRADNDAAGNATEASSCGYAKQVDVKFDVNFDGPTFATCRNVPIANYDASSTPYDFAYCKPEFTRCSPYDSSHGSRVCVRNNVFCRAAELYCAKLKGDYYGDGNNC